MRKRAKSILALVLALGLTVPSGSTGLVEPVSMVSTVEAATNRLTLSVANKNVYVGASAKLNVKATKGAKLTYRTSNKGIVTVNSKGNIKGRKAGTAKIYITAKASGRYKKATKTVVVKVIKQTSTPAVKPTTTPKPTAKPTATPKPTAVPKPTATPMPTATPTATPTPVPVVEPTDVQKAEIDNICSKQYYNPWMYINSEMCKASSFKFTTDKSLSGKGNYCYVESSDSSLVTVHTDDGITLYSDAVDPISESNIGKTVTVTMKG